MNCRDVEPHLAPYVDDEVTAATPAIAAHLAACAACRDLVAAQRAARVVLKARAAQLSPPAPPGLRTRLRALDPDRATARPAPELAWAGRLSALAAAVIVVLALGAVLLPAATIRSTTLLAAQMALDHLKCFTLDGHADAPPISKTDAEALLRRQYGFTMSVPPSAEAERLQLMAVRRCLYGDGLAAHVMYRVAGEPVSLFILPGVTRAPAELSLLGQEQVIWTKGDSTYILVARTGFQHELGRVASYVQNEAQ